MQQSSPLVKTIKKVHVRMQLSPLISCKRVFDKLERSSAYVSNANSASQIQGDVYELTYMVSEDDIRYVPRG